MGARNIYSIIRNLAKVKKLSNNILSNKIVVIDFHNFLYRNCISVREKLGDDYKNNSGELSSHLYVTYELIIKLRNYNIKPVCIFDGKPTELKKNTINERKEKKKEALELYNKAILNNEIKTDEYLKNFKNSFNLTKKHFNECRELLNYLGVVYIDAPCEADIYCGYIGNIIDEKKFGGIISDDSDILLFKGKKLLKNFNIDTETYEEYNLSEINNFFLNIINSFRKKLNKPNILNFDHKYLLLYSIFSGNDLINNLSDNLYKFNLISFLTFYNFDINLILNNIKNIFLTENDYNNYVSLFNKVHEYYTYYNINNIIELDFTHKIQYSKLEELLCDKYNYNKDIFYETLKLDIKSFIY